VHNFMDLTGLSWENMMGATHKSLRENLSRLFLGRPYSKTDDPESLSDLGIAGARYRLAILYCYPDITRYCRTFREDSAYQTIYMEVFRMLYTAAVSEIRSLSEEFDDVRLAAADLHLSEIQTSVERLALPETDLMPEKEAVREAFADLVRTIEFHDLEKVMVLQEKITRITQDTTFRLQAYIRECLVEKCRMSLDEFSRTLMDVDKARSGILRRLYYHARHYRPQQRFYDLLYRSCVGSPESGKTEFLTGLIKSNPRFVRGLMLIFSDEKSMQGLLSPEQISHARDLLIL
jgi:hypothetical protein